MDLKGLHWGHVVPTALQMLKKVMDISRRQYPEVCGVFPWPLNHSLLPLGEDSSLPLCGQCPRLLFWCVESGESLAG